MVKIEPGIGRTKGRLPQSIQKIPALHLEPAATFAEGGDVHTALHLGSRSIVILDADQRQKTANRTKYEGVL